MVCANCEQEPCVCQKSVEDARTKPVWASYEAAPDDYPPKRAIERWARGEGELRTLLAQEMARAEQEGRLTGNDAVLYERCDAELARATKLGPKRREYKPRLKGMPAP